MTDWNNEKIETFIKDAKAMLQAQGENGIGFAPNVFSIIEHLQSQVGLPDPLVLEFGTGKIDVHRFKTDNDFGLMFSATDQERKIGSYGDKPAEKSHDPQKGEIYLAFSNQESLQVIIEELAILKEQTP